MATSDFNALRLRIVSRFNELVFIQESLDCALLIDDYSRAKIIVEYLNQRMDSVLTSLDLDLAESGMYSEVSNGR